MCIGELQSEFSEHNKAGSPALIFRSSVLGGRRRGGARRRAPLAVGQRGWPRVPAFSLFTSLPFLRSCGGAGKRRGLASGARVIGCPGPLARSVRSSPGGEGRSGHCSNHRRHYHGRSRLSLGHRASNSERLLLPGRADADRDAALCWFHTGAMTDSRA